MIVERMQPAKVYILIDPSSSGQLGSQPTYSYSRDCSISISSKPSTLRIDNHVVSSEKKCYGLSFDYLLKESDKLIIQDKEYLITASIRLKKFQQVELKLMGKSVY